MIIKTTDENITEHYAVSAIEKDANGRVLAYYLSRNKYSAYRFEVDENDKLVVFDDYTVVDEYIPRFWETDRKSRVTSFPEWLQHDEIVRYYTGGSDLTPETAQYLPVFEKYYEEIVKEYITRKYGSVAKFYRKASKKSGIDAAEIKLVDLTIEEIVNCKVWPRNAKPEAISRDDLLSLLNNEVLFKYCAPYFKLCLKTGFCYGYKLTPEIKKTMKEKIINYEKRIKRREKM